MNFFRTTDTTDTTNTTIWKPGLKNFDNQIKMLTDGFHEGIARSQLITNTFSARESPIWAWLHKIKTGVLI